MTDTRIEEMLSHHPELQSSAVYWMNVNEAIEVHIRIDSSEDDVVQSIVDEIAFYKSVNREVPDVALMCSFSDHDVDQRFLIGYDREHAVITIDKENAYESISYKRIV